MINSGHLLYLLTALYQIGLTYAKGIDPERHDARTGAKVLQSIIQIPGDGDRVLVDNDMARLRCTSPCIRHCLVLWIAVE